MQTERRSNPYPFSWEIPLGVFCAALLVLVLGAHGGRAAANLFAGGGLTWPPTAQLFTSLPALIGGDAGAGLAGHHGPVASPAALRAWVITVEALTVAGCAALGVLAWARWGPGRMRGMATTGEANNLLGQARLRKHRAVIRPDLHHGGRR